MTEQNKNGLAVIVAGRIIGILLNGSPNDDVRIRGFAAFIIAMLVGVALVSTAFWLA